MSTAAPALHPLGRIQSAATTIRVLGGAGVLRPRRPSTLLALGKVLREWGVGPAGGFASLAVRDPDGVGVIDDLGELTWAQLHGRTNALARGLAARGVDEGASVAVMCRNHRGFLEATIAVAKLGADVLYLNTAFAGPELVDVLAREAPVLVIHDEEYADLVADAPVERTLLAWTESGSGADSLERLIAAGDQDDLTPPTRHGRIIILTSGTTGTAKGAPRKEAGIDAAVSLTSRMPLHVGWRTHIAAPLFHTWGFAHMALAMLYGSTIVLRRAFDPESALRTVQDERCETLVVIPVMMQRILALGEDVLDTITLDELRVVASSGSGLPATLAPAWMDRFGDNLYNIYGSTEVSYASVATPPELRTSPTTAGRPPPGTTVRILDHDGAEVPTGETGRIFVGNQLLFEGYTDGGSKQVIDGRMATGDMGRFDAHGLLFVEGRDDDMVVSGGENVFPQEVENCLATHPAVVEAACVGVPDAEYGSRLCAFVVSSAAVDEEELRDHVRDRLARYKVPREVRLVDELPRNATGKVLKRDLTREATA